MINCGVREWTQWERFSFGIRQQCGSTTPTAPNEQASTEATENQGTGESQEYFHSVDRRRNGGKVLRELKKHHGTVPFL